MNDQGVARSAPSPARMQSDARRALLATSSQFMRGVAADLANPVMLSSLTERSRT